jgi:hypothetical protein
MTRSETVKLTPAQELTLWEMDRARMGDYSTSGREGWLVPSHWNYNTLRALRKRGLIEFKQSGEMLGVPQYVVRLTDAGNERVPTL